MKNKGIHISFLVLNKMVITLMVFIFTGMPLLEIFHTHETDSETELKIEVKNSFNTNKKTSFQVHQPSCKFCHQLSHHQPTPLLSISSISLLYFTHSNLLISNNTVQKLIPLPGLSWTNKGPPSPFC